MKKVRNLTIIMLMAFLLVGIAACSVVPSQSGNNGNSDNALAISQLSGYTSLYSPNTKSVNTELGSVDIQPNDMVWVTVSLGEGLATKYLENGIESMDIDEYLLTPAGIAETAAMSKEQSIVIANMEATGVSFEVENYYTVLNNGFSMYLQYKDISTLQNVAGVEGIYLAEVYDMPEVTVDDVNDSLYGETGIFSNVSGYQGDGMTIAILDTGIDYNHEAFQLMPEVTTLNFSFIEEKLALTTAYSRMRKKLTAENVYLNAKIPFAFDYADKDYEVNPSQAAVLQYKGFHGTHVAGIAAGNDSEIQGVAKNAQLAIMKVFSDESSGANFTDITAALEDCIILGIDVANLSLGSPCGYVRDNSASAKIINAVYDLVDTLGLTLCVATGNDNNSTYSSSFENLNFASNPDNGVVNSPASYVAAYAIGSVLNNTENLANGIFTPASSSSMGALNDLSIGVDVMGVGGGVLSAINAFYSQAKGTDTHIKLSGTSMATPNVSGVLTILKQYYKEIYPTYTDRQLKVLCRQILTSTATLITNEDGNPLTPRRQGSGVANLEDAMNATAYLTVTGSDDVKLNLGSDLNKDGIYTLNFNLVNIADEEQSYYINTKTFTETVVNGYIAEKAYMFDDAITDIMVFGGDYDNGIVTVDANSSASIRVSIEISADDKAYMDETFVNGIYVEGYALLSNVVDGSTLTIPWISFYGDWDAVPIFDGTIYDGNVQVAENGISITKYSGIITEDIFGPAAIIPLGSYMYDLPNGAKVPEASIEKIAINDNLGIGRIYFSLLRNTSDVIIRVIDNVTGVVYDEGTLGGLAKTRNKKGVLTNYPYLDLGQDGSFNASNYTWANNQDMSFVVEGYLENGAKQSLVYNMFIDYEDPTLVNATMDDDNKLNMTVYDNHYLQAVMLYAKEGDKLIDIVGNAIPVYDFVKNTNNDISIDLTDYMTVLNNRDLVVELVDYAGNSVMYNADTAEDNVASTGIKYNDYILQLSENYNVSVESATMLNADENSYLPMLDEEDRQGDFYIDGTTLVAYVGQGGDVVIPDGVTEIGANVFYFNSMITSVVVPEGVTVIGNAAFKRAYNMTKVVLPSTLTQINTEAFAGCVNLSDINLEDTKVSVYGKYSFVGNNAIKEITIPKVDTPIQMSYTFSMMFALEKLVVLGDVEYTDTCFFVNPSLKEVEFHGNTMIGKKNVNSNAFQSCDALETIKFYGKTAIGREYALSSGTVVSTNCLIALASLKEVYFYGDVEFIYGKAFNGCPNLEKVVFGGLIGAIGQEAFGASPKLNKGFDLTPENTNYIKEEGSNIVYNKEMTTMYRPSETEIEGVYTLPETVTELPARAFSHSVSIMYSVGVSYELTDDGFYTYRISSSSTDYVTDREKMTGIILNDNITTIPDRCFADNVNLTFDYSNITRFEDKALFNTGFTELKFTDDVTYFGNRVWASSKKLETLEFPETATYKNFDYFYAGLTMKEIQVPAWMSTGMHMFRESDVEKVVFLNENLTTLGKFLFYLCDNLTTVEGVEKVTSLAGWTFDYCSSIKSIDLPALQTIGSATFQNCESLEYVNYGDDLRYIGSGAFNFCSSLKRIYITNAITNLYMSSRFYQCNGFEEFVVQEGHPTYATVDGALYTKDLNTLVKYPTKSKVTEHTLPAAITTIADNTFADAPYLEKLNYEASSLVIGSNAFINNVSLKEFDFSRVTYIGNQAFRNTALASVELSNSIDYVGSYAFADNDSLESIYIAENTAAFDYSSAFSGCYNVKDIDIAEGCVNFVTENNMILNGDRTLIFMGFGDVSEVIVPEGVLKISERAFYGNTSIKKIVLPESLVAIGDKAFYGCNNIEEIVFNSKSAPRLEGFAIEGETYTYANFGSYFEDVSGIKVYVENDATYLSYVWRVWFDEIYVNTNNGYQLAE